MGIVALTRDHTSVRLLSQLAACQIHSIDNQSYQLPTTAHCCLFVACVQWTSFWPPSNPPAWALAT